MEINGLTITFTASALVILLPCIGVVLSYVVGCMYAFIQRLDELPPNFVLGLFKARYIKVVPSEISDGKWVIYDSIFKRYLDITKWYPHEKDAFRYNARELAEVRIRIENYNLFWVIFPLGIAVLMVGLGLYYVPLVVMSLFTAIVTMFLARWLCDLYKYVSKVKEQLDNHKKDPDAHKNTGWGI